MHTSLVSKRIYLKRRLLEQMKWKEEMKVRSTNVESAPPRKKKFATLAHQLVSLSMKFSAQKREKKTKTSFFKLYKSYIYSVPLDSRVKLVLLPLCIICLHLRRRGCGTWLLMLMHSDGSHSDGSHSGVNNHQNEKNTVKLLVIDWPAVSW